jgi:hypothetical protein
VKRRSEILARLMRRRSRREAVKTRTRHWRASNSRFYAVGEKRARMRKEEFSMEEMIARMFGRR